MNWFVVNVFRSRKYSSIKSGNWNSINSKNCVWRLQKEMQFAWAFKELKLLPPASEGWGEVIFSVCVSPHLGGGTPSSWRGWGYPLPRSWHGGGLFSWWGYPIPGPGGRGLPHPRSRWGVPHSQVQAGGYPIPGPVGGTPFPGTGGGVPFPRSRWGVPHQTSTACTCYAAGSMPLAFTQEDFLVGEIISDKPFPKTFGFIKRLRFRISLLLERNHWTNTIPW